MIKTIQPKLRYDKPFYYWEVDACPECGKPEAWPAGMYKRNVRNFLGMKLALCSTANDERFVELRK